MEADDQLEDKALGQFRLQLHGILDIFSCYGMGIWIPLVEEQLMDLAIRLHMRLNDEDVPFEVNPLVLRGRELPDD